MKFLGSLVVVMTCCCGLWAYGANPYVFGRADFATGNVPYAIVSADFNGDGLLDFAVANFGDNTVSVFFGKADGSFAKSADYAVGVGPDALVAGDFNGDGRPDLAVVNQNCNNVCSSTFVSVLLNKGDGTFQLAVSYATDTDPVSIVVADFDGDGKLDLAVANAISTTKTVPGEVSVYLNNGDGTFRLGGKCAAGPHAGQLTTINLASGSKPSLAITNFVSLNGVNAVSVLRNNGSGGFGLPVMYNTGLGPVSVASADFNQDGIPDLAVLNGADSTVSIFLGKSDGTFASRVNYPVAFGPNHLLVTDMNQDGKPDLVVTASTTYTGGGAISILVGKGDGTFQAAVSYGAGNNPFSLAAGDFNHDGRMDVAFSNGDVNRVSVLLGNGDGTLPSYATYSGGYEPIAMAAADLNGDGLLDVVVADYGSNTVSVLFGTVTGKLVLQGSYAVGVAPNSVAVADLNGDGKPDIVVTNSGDNTISILYNNGGGVFAVAMPIGVGLNPGGVAIGDFNGDHRLDLAIANTGDNTVSVLLNLGNNNFRPAASYPTGPGPTGIVTVDLNGDGKPDLVVANFNSPVKLTDSGYISVLINRGDGSFAGQVEYQTAYHPCAIAAGDFNGDGKMDLAVAGNLDIVGTVSVLLGNGDGTLQPAASYTDGFSITGMTMADFNGDGKPDLAVVSNLNNTVFLLKGMGDGSFQVQGTYGTIDSPIAVVAGNFVPKMGTGKGADLLVANFSRAALSLFVNGQ